jgi:hypothetical protein
LTPSESAGAVARLDRILRYALPFLLLIVAADLLDGIVRGPQWMWNEARLARSFSLASGYRLYPGEHALEPIIGTMHAPMTHFLYAGLSFLKDPGTAMLAGCCLSVVLCMAPLFWVHRRAAGLGKSGIVAAAFGFLACAAALLSNPGSSQLAVSIHVDAGAVGFAVLAAGILGTSRSPIGTWALACSAAFGVISVACKQTMLPVPVALACYVLIAEGRRRFAAYALVQVLSGAVLAAAMAIIFHPLQALVFNTYTLGTHLHGSGTAARILEGMYNERLVLGSVIPALAVLSGCAFFSRRAGIAVSLRANPWIVFLFVAVLQTVTALRAFTTPWGDYNHLSVVTLFITMTVTVALTSLRRSGEEPAIPHLVQRALLLGIIVAALPLPWALAADLAKLPSAPADTAFRYEKLHPGRAYFPLNPLAVLLADGRLTHFDYSLADRERAGFPVTRAQFAAGLPPHYQLVAYPATYDPPQSSAVLRLVQSMEPTTEPGLEGWRVYGLPTGKGVK